MTTFFIKSLGCKISQYDGERLSESLRELGLKQEFDNPELYILNGCSVTSRASQKDRQALRAAKRKWPACKIVLAGCEARLTLKHNQSCPEADWLLPYFDNASIAKMLSSLGLKADSPRDTQKKPITAKTRAYLKVQDGCAQFCSYCIVSRIRGKEWSKGIEEAVNEARLLVEEGHKEVVLTGIHLGHFKPSLTELLIELEKIKGLKRIRLSSIEPIEVNDELINWFANSKKACPHFHLPLQSGCDEILKKMCRPYTTGKFMQIINKIRAKMPNAGISTDLIVGFPSETEECFAQTLNFIKQARFSKIHIFKFSPRIGTPAANMPSQTSNAEKALRSDRVEEIYKASAKEFYKKFVGKDIEVLWETYKDGFMHGLSREYAPCFLKADSAALKNTILVVKCVSANDNGLFCSLKTQA